MSATASQITILTIVYSTVYSGADQRNIKLRVTDFCVGNSPLAGEFPAQRASNAENVSIWWRHHVFHHPLVRLNNRVDYIAEKLINTHTYACAQHCILIICISWVGRSDNWGNVTYRIYTGESKLVPCTARWHLAVSNGVFILGNWQARSTPKTVAHYTTIGNSRQTHYRFIALNIFIKCESSYLFINSIQIYSLYKSGMNV